MVVLQNGVDIKSVSRVLGHYSVGFTLDTYYFIRIEIRLKLSEDYAMGKLSADRFAKLSESFAKEQAELRQTTEELQTVLGEAEMQSVNMQSFYKIVKNIRSPPN